MNERDDIAEYIGTLQAGEASQRPPSATATPASSRENAKELAAIAAKHGLATAPAKPLWTASWTG